MIDIIFNGENVKILPGISLAELIEEKNYEPHSFAAAVNEYFISRDQYSKIIIHPGDRIEIVTAMQGG